MLGDVAVLEPIPQGAASPGEQPTPRP